MTSLDSHQLSSSLPSGFRYSWSSTPLSRTLSSFYSGSRDHSELPVPTVDSAQAKTRLEILQGWEVNFAVLCQYAASFIAFIYVLVKLNAFATAWEAALQVPNLSKAEDLFRHLLQLASFLLPIFFGLNLVLHGAVTDEQIWTFVLLAVGLFAVNPLSRDILAFSHQNPPWRKREMLEMIYAKAVSGSSTRHQLIWNEALYTAVIYLYLLLAAHSYRVFEVRKIHSLAFYAPKLALASTYFLVKVIAGFKADLSLGMVPYSRVLTWAYLVRGGRATMRVTLPVLITTILDTVFGFWLMREVATTADFLATVSYVENRSKQLGFRCFVYQTLTFCFNMIGLSMLITYMLPGSFIYATFDDPSEHFFQLEPPVARLALAVVYFTWTLVLAYVNLPPKPFVPFAQDVIARTLYLVRNTRIAVWLGVADIVNTEDAEDSSVDEEGDVNDEELQNSFGRSSPSILNVKPNIPFLYLHRELFDQVMLSPRRTPLVSPLVLTEVCPILNPTLEAPLLYDDDTASARRDRSFSRARAEEELTREPHEDASGDCLPTLAAPRPIRHHVSNGNAEVSVHTNPVDITSSTSRYQANVQTPTPNVYRRARSLNYPVLSSPRNSRVESREKRQLRMRKNLFVMETQVMMANAAYLAYVPGNKKEERVARMCKEDTSPMRTSALHTGSLANDLDELAMQIEEENRLFNQENKATSDDEEGKERPTEEEQPDEDDGTFFRVDPHAMAEKYGYKLYRHVMNEEHNLHAIVLISSSRVIVAFSGTRVVSNWSVNTNISRAVLDEKLTRFEYEMSSESHEVDVFDECGDISNSTNLQGSGAGRVGRHKWLKPLRKCRSEESLDSLQHSSRGIGRDADAFTSSRPGKTYGSIIERREGSEAPEETPADLRRRGMFTLATQQGVAMVANTFRHELLTFGKPKVHEGFIDAYMTLRKQVMGTLVELYKGKARSDIEDPDMQDEESAGVAESLPLFFCGHSLGGALATFASYEAARYFKRIGLRRRHDVSCTTFGSPRIGNEAFKARYERLVETHWRFEIASDPIAKVPFAPLNYVPVGVRVLLDQSGMLLIDPSFIEVQWWGLTNLYLAYRLHIRASYCMALRTYCKLYRNGIDDLGDSFWPFPIKVQTRGLFHHAHR